MRIKNFSVCFILAVIILSLTSCSEGKKNEITKDTLIGEWYSDELHGSFVFKDDDMLYLKVDFTDMLYIDENGSVELNSGNTDNAHYNYDGTLYSFSIGEGDEEIDMITMERKGEPSDSVYGKYTLVSGIFYDQLSAQYGDMKDRYGMIVSENRLDAEIRMCGYETDGEIITFTGDGMEDIFGISDNTENTARYRCIIEKDVMTLVAANGNLVFTKVTE
ncbi:MAG: hypothetical protein K2J37_00440 [Ruminococcus sp.]|nr:hypothetical protein [Ruminococcus sp.]MDE6785221.1 hypothetical protein [Ruminococcus sp.]